jgi:hypothetical protein
MSCNGRECPICYEKVGDNDASYTCRQCKQTFNLQCLLKSCERYWNNGNKNCECPYCRSKINDDNLRDINDIVEKIQKNENKIDLLWNQYSTDISITIQQMYGQSESDISSVIGDQRKLDAINQLKIENTGLQRQIYLKSSFKPDWVSELGGSRRYKKKTIKRNIKTAMKKTPKRSNRKNGKKSKKYSRK